ncbi:MAG: hypothetical protein K2Z80_16870 [Xanthobacteraceae bacterium]|nr:hypothetical protein [Xanthobacteraceae bacterium]
MAAISLPFHALLVWIAFSLRRPVVCAVVWIMLRLAVFVSFVIAGALKGGDEGFMLFGWNYALDLPLLPLLERARAALSNVCGANCVNVFTVLVYVAWYGGGGYLAARWARRRFARS